MKRWGAVLATAAILSVVLLIGVATAGELGCKANHQAWVNG